MITQYINKSALVAEVKRLAEVGRNNASCFDEYRKEKAVWLQQADVCDRILSFLNALEVKEVETWHLQEKEDIYDAVKDWNLHTFACIMKDGTIQKFSGILDEDCEGHISVHIDGVNDDYDNVDDIVKWIEYT